MMTKNNARIRRATKSRANMAYLGKTRLSIHPIKRKYLCTSYRW